MKSKSASNIILEKYFNDLVAKKEPIPFTTGVQNDTGISASTVTRYAKMKGYYGFPDMRSDLMKSYNKVFIKKSYSSQAIRLFDFLSNNDKIVIYTSQSTKPVGYFLLERLKTFKDNVVMLEDLFALSTAEYGAITITISNESARVDKLLTNTKKFKEVLSISCASGKHKNEIVLDKFLYEKRTNNELFKSMREVNEWLQETIDEFTQL